LQFRVDAAVTESRGNTKSAGEKTQ
jgi:hypothetical protein